MPFKLQRWWLPDRWDTIKTTENRKDIDRALKGWRMQIPDGTFRIVDPRNTIVKIVKGSLYKKVMKTRG